MSNEITQHTDVENTLMTAIAQWAYAVNNLALGHLATSASNGDAWAKDAVLTTLRGIPTQLLPQQSSQPTEPGDIMTTANQLPDDHQFSMIEIDMPPPAPARPTQAVTSAAPSPSVAPTGLETIAAESTANAATIDHPNRARTPR